MTEQEFRRALDLRVYRAFYRQAQDRVSSVVFDGLVLHHLSPSHEVPILGEAWTLGAKQERNDLEVRLSPKAHDAWRRGDFEKILPSENDDSWLDYDPENFMLRIRLTVRENSRD